MNNIIIYENNSDLEKLLSPMEYILDKKNITEGRKNIKEKGKLYICFDKDYLSITNKLIIEKISFIYSEMIFYSDNIESPSMDRLEYWCPDEEYDKKSHKTERIQKKKLFVLELDLTDQFSILGITIMLANCLQEQDPMSLKINENVEVLSSDIITRHQHYIDNGSPDSNWILLMVSLNKDNPLRENFYAPFMSVCEINSPVSCDNIVLTTMVGFNEKKYINFDIERTELEKAIEKFFSEEYSVSEQNSNIISEIQKKLLKVNLD